MFKVFQPVIVKIERLSIFVAAGLVPAIFQPRMGNKKRPQGSQLQEYRLVFYYFGLVVLMSHKNLEHRVIGKNRLHLLRALVSLW